jgi:signal peptidase I
MKKRLAVAVCLLILSVFFSIFSIVIFSQKLDWNARYQTLFMGGEAMSPTIKTGDLLVVENTKNPTQIYAAPKPDGDIIVFYQPFYRNASIVRRAIQKVAHDGVWHFQTKADNYTGADFWSGSDTWNGMISEQLLIGKVSEINPSWNTIFFITNVWIFLSITLAVFSGIVCLLIIVIPLFSAPLVRERT